MNATQLITILLTFLICSIGCKETSINNTISEDQSANNFEAEKKAIIATLNNETKAAFQRNYQDWTDKWVHDPTITKSYINVPEQSYSESVGWKEISSFVKTYIEEHPEPEPLPTLLNDIEVRLYGNGAWVSYEQQNAIHGLKKETRLMEKTDGQWRIAGMQTIIYGLQSK